MAVWRRWERTTKGTTKQRNTRAYWQAKHLELLREHASDLGRDARKNYFRRMMVEWLVTMSPAWFLIGVVVAMAFSGGSPLLALVPLGTIPELESVSSVMFTATITVNGVLIGFSALCSFNYIRDLRETNENTLESAGKAGEKSKGEEKELYHKIWFRSFASMMAIWTGVSRYTFVYVFISIYIQALWVGGYFILAISGHLPLIPYIDLIVIFVVSTGIMPILGRALARPSVTKEIRENVPLEKDEPSKS